MRPSSTQPAALTSAHAPSLDVALRPLAYLAPLLLLAALLALYLIAPDFYLRYVLEYQHREYQAVEMVTFGCSLGAGILLAFAAWHLWKQRPALPPGATLHQRFDQLFPAAVIASLAAASLFLAGEEVSWGQTFVHWGVPEITKQRAYETNIHNNLDLPMQTVGQIYLAVVLFGLPLAWMARKRLNLPAFWSPAIAEGPVIFCAAVAMAWKFVKEVYGAVLGQAESDRFYWEFIEQLNEQKEMLIAVALLMLALYRVRDIRRGVQGSRT